MNWLSQSWLGRVTVTFFLGAVVLGCGGSSQEPTGQAAAQPGSEAGTKPVSLDAADRGSDPTPTKSDEPAGYAPIKLGGGSTSAPSGTKAAAKVPPEKQREAVMQALKPMYQVLVGQWHGISQKSAGGAKGYEEFAWVWDHRSDKARPALTMTTEGSPHMKSARLTYLVDEEQYQLTVEDKDGQRRELRGSFSQEPLDVPGEDKKQTPQRTYKLLLTETGDAKDRWQAVVNQQENNRYLLELSRARGSRFTLFDTIGNQRQGTSFALNDADFKEKTCVISQGLGTIQVSHNGKSYWVCCSGCKAAFEEDPEKWIAKFEALQTNKP